MSDPRKRLLRIYDLYALWAGEFSFACVRGCSTCCTQSVSMTMLEGELIRAYLCSEKRELPATVNTLPPSSLNPITTNQFAAACLREEEGPEEDGAWNMAPCAFLRENCCAIYPVRPFMCRSFGSRVPCHQSGTAEVDPLFLTLNTVIMQCIEHLDRGRPWGNMNTILRMSEGNRATPDSPEANNFRIAQALPGLLIPPEEKQQLEKQLHLLMEIIGP